MDVVERTPERAVQAAFARENRFALFFLNVGAADYGAARCCLLNHEVSGFQLGAQAIEKTMKGILLLLDKRFNPRGASHGLEGLNKKLIEKASAAALLSDTSLKRFMGHYNDRYPHEDGNTEVGSFSTSEITDLDEVMLHLVTNEPDVPTRYRCGVGARLYDLATSGKSNEHSRDRWLITNNSALDSVRGHLLPKIADAFV